MSNKECLKCLTVKPFNEYYPLPSGNTRNKCKRCVKDEVNTKSKARNMALGKSKPKNNVIHSEGETAKILVTSKGINHEFIIDREDVPLVKNLRWINAGNSINPYATAHIGMENGKAKRVFLHRLITGFKHEFVDHINGNTEDNRKANLRGASKAQNAMNRKVRRESSTGIKGVFFQKNIEMYYSKIGIRGRNLFLGFFDTKEEAALAYNCAARKFHGEFARLNKEAQ